MANQLVGSFDPALSVLYRIISYHIMYVMYISTQFCSIIIYAFDEY